MEKQALEWWNSLDFESQFYKVIEFARDCEHPHRMTTEDILQVHEDYIKANFK